MSFDKQVSPGEEELAGSSPKKITILNELQHLTGQVERTERLVFGAPPKPVEEKAQIPTVSKVDSYIRIIKLATEKLRGINTTLEAL